MRTISIIFLTIIIIFLGYLVIQGPKTTPTAIITTFEECTALGYPILETYPEQCKTPDGKTFTKALTTLKPSPEPTVAVLIENIVPNQMITSPLIVTGKIRGNWSFEANVPVKIVDANNTVLTSTYATLEGDWMTTEYVPFKSEPLVFGVSPTKTGAVVIAKANPSGLPENDDVIRIPIEFAKVAPQRTVKLFFYNSTNDTDISGNILCSAKGLVAVTQSIAVSKSPIQDAIKLLLRTNESVTDLSGTTTEFPLEGVALTAATLANGTLTITISDPQQKTNGGSCRTGIMRAQIEATAKQFPEVKKVVVKPATVFQP